MALSASQARTRQSTDAGLPASSRRRLDVVTPRRARPARMKHWVVALAAALAVGSLLAVVGVRAYMTEGQVRLTRLQDEVSSQLVQYRSLQLRIAQLEQPANVLSKAKSEGLVVPSHVTDVPEVSSSVSEVATSRSSSAGSSSAGSSSAGSASSGGSHASGSSRSIASSARSTDR